MAGYGENYLVNILNECFDNNGDSGIAYRFPQTKFTSQVADILVDSRKTSCAIEVKSFNGIRNLSYGFDFTVDRQGKHQLERMITFCSRSGRMGYIVIFNKHDGMVKYYVIKLGTLYAHYRSGEKYLTIEDMSTMNDTTSTLYKLLERRFLYFSLPVRKTVPKKKRVSKPKKTTITSKEKKTRTVRKVNKQTSTTKA